MMDLTFANPQAVHLIWLWIVVVLFWAKSNLGESGRFSAFSSDMRGRLIVRNSRRRRWFQLIALLVVFLFSTLAMMRPQTPNIEQQAKIAQNSGDIIVALDLSKSMLAEDASPNRLKKAVSEIKKLIDEMDSHRVGLVGFAGRATVLCPLTTDRGFFNLALDNADPFSIAKGGTRIGDAIRISTKAFGPGEASKVIILVTDGEDHDSYPLDEADKAKERGISIVSVGFGSESGSPIIITDPKTRAKESLLDRDGNVVNSKLDGETLREIATKTEGVYVPAGTGNLDLKSIVAKHIKPIIRNADTKSHKVLPNEVYFPFVLTSFLGFVTLIWLSGLGRRRES